MSIWVAIARWIIATNFTFITWSVRGNSLWGILNISDWRINSLHFQNQVMTIVVRVFSAKFYQSTNRHFLKKNPSKTWNCLSCFPSGCWNDSWDCRMQELMCTVYLGTLSVAEITNEHDLERYVKRNITWQTTGCAKEKSMLETRGLRRVVNCQVRRSMMVPNGYIRIRFLMRRR